MTEYDHTSYIEAFPIHKRSPALNRDRDQEIPVILLQLRRVMLQATTIVKGSVKEMVETSGYVSNLVSA